MQLVYDYPEALLQGRPQRRGRAFVEQQLARFPTTDRCTCSPRAPTPRRTSRCSQHRHQGEYYAWQGNLKGAIDQFELASKAKDGDFYQASVVDTRLRALQREVADQAKSAFGNSG